MLKASCREYTAIERRALRGPGQTSRDQVGSVRVAGPDPSEFETLPARPDPPRPVPSGPVVARQEL